MAKGLLQATCPSYPSHPLVRKGSPVSITLLSSESEMTEAGDFPVFIDEAIFAGDLIVDQVAGDLDTSVLFHGRDGMIGHHGVRFREEREEVRPAPHVSDPLDGLGHFLFGFTHTDHEMGPRIAFAEDFDGVLQDRSSRFPTGAGLRYPNRGSDRKARRSPGRWPRRFCPLRRP